MQDRISRELMQLHAVNKKQPMKKFMGRERETMEKKGKKHHPEASLRVRDDLGAREDNIGRGHRNPSSLAFTRSASMRVEAVQPTACIFVDFFAICLRWATHLMVMQWQGA
jgi:hypothetical protein